MARKIRKQNKRGVGISLEGLIGGIAQGIGGLLGFAAEMERQNKSEYAEQGEIRGKTKSGKEYRGVYGFRVKVGLHNENLKSKAQMPNQIQNSNVEK